MKNLGRNVTMLCPVCGNDQFESLNPEWNDFSDAPDDIKFRCSDCGKVITKEDLLSENSEKIEVAIDEMKNDAVKEIEKELKKALKKWKF